MSDKLLVQKLSIDNGRDREKQDRNRENHPSNKGKRALKNIPLGVAVEEGQQHQHGPKEAGQYHRTEKLSKLAGKHLQTQALAEEQEAPLRFRVLLAGLR